MEGHHITIPLEKLGRAYLLVHKKVGALAPLVQLPSSTIPETAGLQCNAISRIEDKCIIPSNK